MCVLAIVFDLNNINEHRRTNIANNVLLIVTICSVSINIIISTFDIADIKWTDLYIFIDGPKQDFMHVCDKINYFYDVNFINLLIKNNF